MNTNLTVTKTPHEVRTLIGELFALAIELNAIELLHTDGRAIAYRGDAPTSVEIVYERAPMASPFERTRTTVAIAAHDAEGATIANIIAGKLAG
jgi:hypothetical protein